MHLSCNFYFCVFLFTEVILSDMLQNILNIGVFFECVCVGGGGSPYFTMAMDQFLSDLTFFFENWQNIGLELDAPSWAKL